MPEVEGVTHHFVTVRGIRVHVAEAGEGEAVVLLHGWPQHWWSWRHVLPELARHHRVICPDIRGLGWSEGTRTGYDLDSLADDVVALADALGVERMALVGHDWGNVIGFVACSRYPERFTKFVGLGGIHLWTRDGLRVPLLLRFRHIYLLAVAGRIATSRSRLPEWALRTWRHAGAFTPDEVAEYAASVRTKASINATAKYYRHVVFRAIPHYFFHYRKVRLTVPTLHINGEHDPLFIGMPDTGGKYADDYRFEIMPGVGHFIPDEAPDRLLEHLTAFLTSEEEVTRRGDS
jgi:pimeloyl-ACP methyl ester carboxylesterase